MSDIVFVPLKGEAGYTRPVHADHVEGDIYEITVGQEPAGEKWQFAPLSRVRCKDHVFEDGTRGLLAYELAK
jgi:hypothetical protein